MSLHADLLAQAQYLARREPRRPRQASLRRAVSAAYYALFHLLTFEASRLFVKNDVIVALLNRVVTHSEMYKVSKAFAQGNLPKLFHPGKAAVFIPQELKDVAQAFVDLQQARHEADYNLASTFPRRECLGLIAQTDQVFRDWRQVSKQEAARLYLGCFFAWERWDKPPR